MFFKTMLNDVFNTAVESYCHVLYAFKDNIPVNVLVIIYNCNLMMCLSYAMLITYCY